MAQQMYPAQVNSPQTELVSAIDDEQTTIPLLDASVLPDPPNLATIGMGEDAETILYTGVSGNDLTGVTRGFQGAAKEWNAGSKVARYFTAYDHNAFLQNIEDHETRIDTAEGDITDLAGEGRTTETVKGVSDALTSHLADNVPNQRGNQIYHVEVVSSSESESPEQGRIIFDTSQVKFFGGNGAEWV